MALFLVQHGRSLSKEVDPGRGLSEEGILDVKRIAETARIYGVRVSMVRHSGKKRARQTAEIFASMLEPAGGILETEGLNPLDDVAAFAEKIGTGENIMLVGHLPFMERLNSFLLIGKTDKPVFKFQNGGILCLDMDTDYQSWVIKWALMPRIG